jgi:membrane-anchored protein YejM (alkaline phosphatase superfamily)
VEKIVKIPIIQFVIMSILFLCSIAGSQNVVIVVIDGARYSETFGADSTSLPNLWTHLRPLGTIWTNFRNNGITKTDPGHAAIATGIWQNIDNKGMNRPNQPTMFEYFRKTTGEPETATALAVGKHKLNILSYSTHIDYGNKYAAFTSIDTDDISTAKSFKVLLKRNHPRLALVNLPSTDEGGHSGDWMQYITALHTADSLVNDIWETLQADSFYHGTTTLFITNDHGRHDNNHGGFKNHGDECEGCRHIMLLAIGRGFSAKSVVVNSRTQCDILPTAGELLSFPTPYSIGTSLLRDTITVQH